MAINYYPWDDTSSGTSGGTWFPNTTSGSISDTTTGNFITNATSSTFSCFMPPPRLYVLPPKAWSDDDVVAFARLTHEVPGFGYHVESIIKGDVLILDPSLPVRDFDAFLPLLRRTSTASARGALAEFLAAHSAALPLR